MICVLGSLHYQISFTLFSPTVQKCQCPFSGSVIAFFCIWAGHVARMDESRNAFKMLTGTPTGKRPLGKPRHR